MKAILTNSIILLILFPVKLLSQPFPESVNTNNKTCTVEPIEKVELSISLILNDDESSHSKEKKKKAISKQIKIANCLYGKKKYQELLEFLKNLNQQINLYTSLGLDNEIFELFFLRGKALRAIGNWQQASSAFKAALNISQAHPTTIESEKLSDLYFNLGRTYRMLNDYTLALDYFNQTLTICIESDFCPKERQAKIYIYMGDCYKFLGKKDLSYIQFKKATSVIDNLQESTRNQILILLLQIKGRMHNYFDEYDDAVQCLEKGIKLCQREYGLYHEKTAYRIDALGNTYYYLKKYSKAIIKFQEAVDVFKALGSKNNYAIADGYSKIAACYTNLNDFQKAEHYLDSCFRILEFDRDIDHPFEEYRSSHTHLLIILYFKAKNHQKAYEAGLGTEELQEAAYWFNLCVELIEYINSTFEESGSKQYLLDRFYYIFEAAINCRYYLYQETGSPSHIEQAFGYAERSKALLLKEAMQMADASPETGIPQRLQEEERRLKKAIIGLENQRYELQQQGEPHTIHELNSEIFDLKQDYHRIVDSIRQQYPRAHRMRYAAAPLAPEHIQNELLSPGQALLQYFLGEEHLFLFVITQQATTLIKRPAEQGLAEAVHRFRESIYGWSRSQEDSLVQQYAIYGHRLYQMLIEPAASMLPERLIIIPDGILEYVPFEALLKEAARPGARPFTSYPFFIRDHQVSYAHSAGLLHEMRNTSYQAPRQWILAFAPAFQDAPDQEQSLASRRRNLGRLVSNVKEVQSIKSLLRTRIFKGDDATRERFLADAPYYSIIHLATHAKANDEEGEYSYLAFTEISDTLQNELLYARDLYSMRLQAEMVVLSACESGVGELRRGEGVISLARGFSYAGAKSLVTTLWRVSDRESAALMELFYRHLKEGEPKDRALREAKLQFINQPGQGRAHPFFWAAFVLSGDMAPIVVEQSRFTVWVLVLLGVLFVFLLARYTKRKPS